MDALQLVFRIRTARAKARAAASAEALSLLGDLGAETLPGGALSEKPRVFHVKVPAGKLDEARSRLPRLGYSDAADLLEPAEPGTSTVRWRRRDYRLVRLYEEDPEEARESAPDRRTFLLETAGGQVRPVRGYRGDGGALSRRALPVCDARLLVNLACAPGEGRTLLDPFAGIAGVVLEALAGGYRVLSCDIDPALRHGLNRAAALHCVADARRLPLGAATVDAVATEPPFDDGAGELITESMNEMHRVLKTGGRIAIMCSRRQAEALRSRAQSLRLPAFLDAAIDRKGTECAVLAWRKAGAAE